MNVKRLILTIATCLCLAICANSQSLSSFDCDLFTFNYPSSYKPMEVINSPHMLLKLEGDEYVITVSCWDKGFTLPVDVWNDSYFDLYKTLYAPVIDEISATRDKLTLGDETVKAIKVLSNTIAEVADQKYDVKLLTYIFVNNEYLYSVCFISEGKYAKTSDTSYPQSIMAGFSLKNVGNNSLAKTISALNAQCPMTANDCATFKEIWLAEKTIVVSVVVPEFCGENDYRRLGTRLMPAFLGYLDEKTFTELETGGYIVSFVIYDDEDYYKTKIDMPVRRFNPR